MTQAQTITPKVSIIMPAYNAERTVRASIDSVLVQTFPDWELVVINDASADKTAEIIQQLAKNDRRVILLENEKNSGISLSRNRGIHHAKGEWLAFLDSDDLWREDKLEKQLKFIEETGALVSYTATAYITETGEMSSEISLDMPEDISEKVSGYILRAEKEFTYKELLKRNLMSCSSVMVRRDVMIPFPEGQEIHEDYVVWLGLVRTIDCAYGLDEPLLIYRMTKGSKSSSRIASAKMTYNAYRHPQVGYGKIAALLLTLRYAWHSIGKRVRIFS